MPRVGNVDVANALFGVTGVLAALKAGGLVPERPEVAVPLVVTALVATAAIAVPHLAWFKRA